MSDVGPELVTDGDAVDRDVGRGMRELWCLGLGRALVGRHQVLLVLRCVHSGRRRYYISGLGRIITAPAPRRGHLCCGKRV